MKARLTFSPFLLLLLATVVILSGWLSRRDLSYGEAFAIYGDPSGLSGKLITASIYLSFALCYGYVLLRLLGRPVISNAKIAIYFSIYYLATVVVPFAFSENQYFNLGYLFSFVAVLAVLLAPRINQAQLFNWARLALGAMIFSSLVGALIAPDKAIASDYDGLGGWISFRLYGVGMGATGLGVVSVAFLILEFGKGHWSFLKLLRVAMAIVALILCQSKTAWIVFLYLLASYVLIGRMRPSRLASSEIRRVRVVLFAGYVVVAAFFLVVLAQGQLSVGSFEGAESIEGLTGRIYIWGVTIQVWLDSPMLGYGLGLWADDGFRNSYGEFRHAHNQFLHTLGASGALGLTGLIIYLIVILKAVVRVSDETEVPLNLYALLITTSLTDVPFLNVSVTDIFFMLHLLILMSVAGVRSTNSRVGTSGSCAPRHAGGRVS